MDCGLDSKSESYARGTRKEKCKVTLKTNKEKKLVMSHEISKIDRQQGIEMAWHKLTEVVQTIFLKTCWLAAWDVEKKPMKEPDGSESEFCRLVCTDDSKIRIGNPVHCDSYGLITNADFLRVCENALREIPGATVASVGSICERGRIFVSIKLAELSEYKAAGREFKPLLNFLSSHDLSAPFSVNTSNICTVCNNTFSANLMSFGKQLSGLKASELASEKAKAVRVVLKHTKNVMDRLENVPEIISGFHGAQMMFRVEMERLAKEKVAVDDANALFAGFLTGSEATDKPLSTRRANQVDRLVDLFRRGAGNSGKNRADVFSAFTDYYTHENAGGDNILRQVVSSEYGDGATRKQEAWSMLRDEKKYSATLARGQQVLAVS